MIGGLHGMFYSTKADEARAFMRDKLRLPFTDVGGCWLLFDLRVPTSAFILSKRRTLTRARTMCRSTATTSAARWPSSASAAHTALSVAGGERPVTPAGEQS
jgi:hypothetical protein